MTDAARGSGPDARDGDRTVPLQDGASEALARGAVSDSERSAFLADVSHELRTPLSLIAAPVHEVLTHEDLDPRTRRSLEVAASNIDRLTRTIDAMLDLARSDADRLVPYLVEVDVADVLRELAEAFGPAVEAAGLTLVSELEDLGAAVSVDRDLLERIVSNLLVNAVKYTARGSITLTLRGGADSYTVAVSDTGIGIATEDQERIFERFQRSSPPVVGDHMTSGAGIGLTMVRDLTTLLGGSVAVDSEAGRGSTFSVTLPVRPTTPAGPPGSSVTPRSVDSFLSEIRAWFGPSSSERPVRRGVPRLLIAEDDAELARFLGDVLDDEYDVVVARDGVEALERIRDGGVDVVLADARMPRATGLDLVRELRADAAYDVLPVVMLSASGTDPAAFGLAEGADDYLTTPFTVADLRVRLAASLLRTRERVADITWRRAVVSALLDPLLIMDSRGRVIEVNEAFTQRFGWDNDEAPFEVPYPWWPTEEEDPEASARMRPLHAEAMEEPETTADIVLYTKDRERVWVHTAGSTVSVPLLGVQTRIRVLRDITHDKEAQERRAAAARVSADFSSADDLATLLGVAAHGFEVLFNGGSTIRLELESTYLFGSGKTLVATDLPQDVANGLDGQPSADTVRLRPGILLVPQSSLTATRAWVQFPRPRRISLEEMIAADLLAQAFGLAVDRIVALQKSADRQSNLQAAVDSHRAIGEAVGILVERHRILPSQAFDRLKQASQNRNIKLRDLARRVIDTGAEPEDA